MTANRSVTISLNNKQQYELQIVLQVRIEDTSVECFLALLEYIYSDHAPIEDTDSVGLMILANRFCLSRLVTLCELYITKEVERCTAECIARSDIDVVGLCYYTFTELNRT